MGIQSSIGINEFVPDRMPAILKMGFFQRSDPFHIVQGTQPIVVAAPHHGTRPNVDSDLGTGPIAQALAERLDGRAVIVSDLRRSVDVNKNPLDLNKNVRQHALRYQDEVFRDLPRLVIEIHGHISGGYPVEVSSGFDLDAALPGDARFLEHLQELSRALPAQLAGKLGQSFEVGIYPLQRDVRKKATNTFTFQKIRRMRKRGGLERYGLHIELAADLRTGKRAKAPGTLEALVEALASAIRSAFLPLPAYDATIPTHADLSDSEPPVRTSLRVTPAPEKMIGTNSTLMNRKDFGTLGLLEGDLISLYNHGEQTRVPVSSSTSIPAGRIAMPAQLRNQLELTAGDMVDVIEPDPRVKSGVKSKHAAFVIGGTEPVRSLQVRVNPAQLQDLRVDADGLCRGRGPFQKSGTLAFQPVPEAGMSSGIVIASEALMRELTLTTGEILIVEKSL